MRPLVFVLSTVTLLADCGGNDAPQQAQAQHGAVSSAVAMTCPEGALWDGTTCTPFVVPGTCTVPPPPPQGSVEFGADRVYATPFRGTAKAAPQAMDIARPIGGTGNPIALFVHGGGWYGGDKRDHHDDIRRVAALGWVGASVNYRLVTPKGDNRFPAGISDVRCAVRWLRAHASELGANGDRIVALGDSAGGELVELLGTEAEVSTLDDGQCEATGDVSVTAVVSYFGRSDLSMPPVRQYEVDYIGRDSDWATRDRLASALYQVDDKTTPMLLVHGLADTWVPIEQSRVFRDALRKADIPVGLVEIPGAPHGFPIFGTRDQWALGACSTLAFLRHFR